jgi:hypothetical protein
MYSYPCELVRSSMYIRIDVPTIEILITTMVSEKWNVYM